VQGNFTGSESFSLNADGSGNWSFKSPRLVTQLWVNHFGHEPSRNYYPVPLIPNVEVLTKIDPSQYPVYHPPNQNVSSCRAMIPDPSVTGLPVSN
jgi:hypothetical protein